MLAATKSVPEHGFARPLDPAIIYQGIVSNFVLNHYCQIKYGFQYRLTVDMKR